MTHSNLKRALAALMVVMMLIGIVPMNVFAGRVVGGGGNVIPSKPVIDEPVIDLDDETSDTAKIADKMESIYVKYIGETCLTTEEIEAKVAEMDYDTLQAIRLENYFLEEKASALSEEEITAFNQCFTPYVDLVSAVESRAGNRNLARTSRTVADGLTFADSANSSSFSNGTYTANAKGSLFSKKTNTITMTNETTAKMKLTFSYSISNQNSYSGLFKATSGNVEVILEAGATTTASIQSKSGLSAGTATVTITNIVFVEMLESADVTMNFDSALGSVTVNGTAVTSGQTLSDLSTNDATTFVATPASGVTFVGWIDDSGMLLGTNATYSTTLAGNKTMKAVFTNTASVPVWYVGGYIYDDFATAASKGGTMVLASNGTLPAGDYTVPANTTLLIPYDTAYTVTTTRPTFVTIPNGDSNYAPTSYAFRTLYMAPGANITVNGAISVSGSQQPGGNYAGVVTGPLGYINMSQNSNITINNGAKLYAWGFITGNGSVLAKSGATVYEDFAVSGWRGGSMTSEMVGNDQGVFIFNSYFVQNVEVPLTYESGAKEMGVMSVNISVIGVQDAEVPFIGQSNSMFNVKSGTAVKAYDGTKDRLSVTVNGNLSVDPMSISMRLGLLGTKNVNSAEYFLPITTNLSAIVNSGTLNINQDISLLPGAEIIVNEGAHCILGKGNSVIVYDADEWGNYDTQFNLKFQSYPANNLPGQKYTRTDADLIDARVLVNGYVDTTQGYLYSTPSGGNVYSTANGKIMTGNSGTKTITYQITQNSNQGIAYNKITIVPALLRNADDSTTSVSGAKNLYTYTDGRWEPCAHNMVAEGYKAATCTDTGLTNREYCSICNIEFVAQTKLPALGHTEVIDAAVAPTCTETGLTEGKHCSVCTAIIVAQKTVAAAGHKYEGSVTIAPTCTTTGIETFTCTVCKADSYTEVMEALGHDMKADAIVPATCTKDGAEAGESCSRCDYKIGYAVIPATGHTEVTDAAVDATCTSTGLTEGKHCSVCNVVTVAQEEVPMLPHPYTGTVTEEPDCLNTGIMTYVCDVCGDTYDDIIKALGHNLIAESEVKPTCTEPGSHEGAVCSRCDYTEGMTEIPALGHDPATVPAVAPTCTETGLTEGQYCSRCNITLVEQEVVDATGHTPAVDAAVAPTCTETGLTEGSHCSVCSVVLVAQEVVPATGHTPAVDAAVAPKCEETGLTEGSHCTVCSVVLVAQDVVPATGHAWDEGVITVEPDCTNTGIRLHTCTNDSTHTSTSVVAALGHTPAVDAAVASTCTETGLTEGSHCSVCNVVLKAQNVVSALGHYMKGATCTDPAKCTREGCTYTEGDPMGHDMTAATCVLPVHCVRGGCGYTEGLPLGHTEVYYEEEPAFCDQEGYTEGYICSVCNEVTSGRELIPALKHDIEYVAPKAPTYTSVGWDLYETCTRCAYNTYVEIPKLPEPKIETYEELLTNLALLEELAHEYVVANPGKDPADLVIKYVRTGVDKYLSGSWGIMAGYEDKGFAKFVAESEDAINCEIGDPEQMLKISGLKNLCEFTMPNGDYYDIAHLFGSMDITYNNKGSLNHADVSGWAGDLVDLIAMTDSQGGFPAGLTFEEKVLFVREKRLGWDDGAISGFGIQDIQSDLDVICIMDRLYASKYEAGTITQIFTEYFTEDLDDVARADYFLKNRLDGVSTRIDVRDTVLDTYLKNNVVTTLESTENIKTNDVATLRKACAYAFADYLCQLAGDYVEKMDNYYYSVFSSTTSTLAPGVTQKINYATSNDGKQMVYYIATADITRDDVNFYANYNENDPSLGWKMSRVLDQANAAQNKYGDPDSPYYIPNYQVVASTNGAGYNMTTGEPVGLLVMNGVQWQDCNDHGFFAILKDGTPYIGTREDYNRMKDQVQEGISAFGSTLIRDGKIEINRTEGYYTDRASRTAIGITKTGKVVMMVLDGRQEPFSCGGSMDEIAQIMYDAGCVEAVNLDGGGSSTFVAKQEGDDELSLVNKPSDGFQRSVSASLMIVSTAPSSTAFDHANLEADYDYLTVGSTAKITPLGVSATGNAAELPEGTELVVADPSVGSITADGTFTALKVGETNVDLVLDGVVLATITMNVVYPDNIYFTSNNVNAVYGQTVDMPVKVTYQGKDIAFNENDVVLTLENPAAGKFEGLSFTGTEGTGIKSVKATATLADGSVSASANINLFNQGEISFDFDQATGGDRILAWDRQVSNSTTEDGATYYIVENGKDMDTSYIFALDMREIPIPERLTDLISMLPGHDIEGASAWTFLMQLAERISVLTTVTAEFQIDPNLDVDLSDLAIVNDYFTLEKVEHDEATNTVRITVRWIDQTAAIAPATANPIFIVNGIKLTPKDGAEWDNNKITLTNKGSVSYDIYMRANALYSFASKVDNQGIYGLKPFVNPDLPSEKGGHFTDVYATVTDTYTLDKNFKDGWVIEEGGYAYYVDGARLTGIQLVEGYYYDFGDYGINMGQTKYNGLVEIDGNFYCSSFGELVTGWRLVGSDQYYFDPNTKAAVNGIVNIGGFTYTFEDYVLVEGHFLQLEDGIRYRWAGRWHPAGWFTCRDNVYCVLKSGYLATGTEVFQLSNEPIEGHLFDENGVWQGPLPDGLHKTKDGNTYYIRDGLSVMGLVLAEDGYYYYFTSSDRNKAVKNCRAFITYDNGLGVYGWYDFDEEGRMIIEENPELKNGFYTEDGVIHYYVNDALMIDKGLIEIDGYYYYINSSGIVVTGRYWVTRNNDLPYTAWQEFDENGRLTVNGELVTPNTGCNHVWSDWVVTKPASYTETGIETKTCTLCGETETREIPVLVPEACKHEWSDWTVTKPATYTETGIETRTCTLCGETDTREIPVKICTHVWGEWVVEVPATYTETGVDIRTCGECGATEIRVAPIVIKNGIITEDGIIRYYVNGKLQGDKGLIAIDGYYYYVNSSAKVVTGRYWITRNNDLPYTAWHDFDEQGRLTVNGELVTPDMLCEHVWGAWVETKPATYTEAGVETRECTLCGKTETREIPVLVPDACKHEWSNWTVTKPATYTEAGIESRTCALCGETDTRETALLVCTHTWSDWTVTKPATETAKGIESRTCSICGKTETRDIPSIVKNGLYTEDGIIRYYVNGKLQGDKGLIAIDGYYYYVNSSAKVVTGRYWITRNNGLPYTAWHDFDEQGRLTVNGELVTPDMLCEHVWGAWVETKPATYTEAGVETRECTLCGKTETREIPVLVPEACKHEWSNWTVTKPATYTEAGIESRTCALCGETDTRETALLVCTHTWSDWTVTKPATETAKGIESRTCSVCGKTETRDIPSIVKNGLYTEDGIIRYYVNGKMQGDKGLIAIDGYYYYVNSSAIVVTGRYWITRNNDLPYTAWHDFDEQGRLTVNGELVVAP